MISIIYPKLFDLFGQIKPYNKCCLLHNYLQKEIKLWIGLSSYVSKAASLHFILGLLSSFHQYLCEPAFLT